MTETHAQEYFENRSYIPQLFRSSHLENASVLTGWRLEVGMALFFFLGDLSFSDERPCVQSLRHAYIEKSYLGKVGYPVPHNR